MTSQSVIGSIEPTANISQPANAGFIQSGHQGSILRVVIAFSALAIALAFLAGGGAGMLFAPKVYGMLGLGQQLPLAQIAPTGLAIPNTASTVEQAAPAAESQAGPAAVDTLKTLEGAQAYARRGSDAAPVQIVLFEDPLCGYCRQFSVGALKQLEAEYVATGKAAITYRHLLVIGPESKTIAKGMACAGKQGKFWAYHDKVYAEDGSLIHSSDLHNGLSESAAGLGLDKQLFTNCLNASDIDAEIQADISVATQLHVLGTPTMYINGKPMLAVSSIEMLRSTIDAELKLDDTMPSK